MTKEGLNLIERALTFFVPKEASPGTVILRAIGDTVPMSLSLALIAEISKLDSPVGLALSFLTPPVALGTSWSIRMMFPGRNQIG